MHARKEEEEEEEGEVRPEGRGGVGETGGFFLSRFLGIPGDDGDEPVCPLSPRGRSTYFSLQSAPFFFFFLVGLVASRVLSFLQPNKAKSIIVYSLLVGRNQMYEKNFEHIPKHFSLVCSM